MNQSRPYLPNLRGSESRRIRDAVAIREQERKIKRLRRRAYLRDVGKAKKKKRVQALTHSLTRRMSERDFAEGTPISSSRSKRPGRLRGRASVGGGQGYFRSPSFSCFSHTEHANILASYLKTPRIKTFLSFLLPSALTSLPSDNEALRTYLSAESSALGRLVAPMTTTPANVTTIMMI